MERLLSAWNNLKFYIVEAECNVNIDEFDKLLNFLVSKNDRHWKEPERTPPAPIKPKSFPTDSLKRRADEGRHRFTCQCRDCLGLQETDAEITKRIVFDWWESLDQDTIDTLNLNVYDLVKGLLDKESE